MSQQGDVLLFQTDDGGDIEVENGVVTMASGLSTSAYLSLFGGNENGVNWWGDVGELPERRYPSDTQRLLKSIPAIPANLKRVEDAVLRDLKWMLSKSVASETEVSATMPGLNKVKITVTVNGDQTLEFVENWSGTV